MPEETSEAVSGKGFLAILSSPSAQSAWLANVLEIEDEEARRNEFDQGGEFHNEELLHLIHGELIRCLYSDRIRARRVEALAEYAGKVLTDDASRAIVERSKGNLLYAESHYAEAVEAYGESIRLFQLSGREAEAGRVYFGGMQALIYLGRYSEAHAWAEHARVRFREAGDDLRLARLELNLGNLYYRQDRYQDAMRHYEEARGKLAVSGQPQDYAAVLSNSAVCRTGMGQFSEALANYREAQDWCRANGLDQLAAAADYNIAYLHYLRGEYRQAADLYSLTRRQSDAVADRYHRALCDLDESEMMLELNMASVAQHMASEAADQFSQLAMPYEYAKALVHGGLARFRRGDSMRALRMLGRARTVFKKEGNQYWAGLLDLYRAIIFEQDGQWDDARRLGERARKILARYSLTGKFALCNLLLAKLALRENRPARSKALLAEAVGSALSPALKCHLSYLSGMVEEELHDPAQAAQHYGEALTTIELARHEFWNQEVKISYLRDKASMYEAFAGLALKSDDGDAVERSFHLVQQAKSRTLLEDLESHRRESSGDEALLEAARDINASYRQVDAVAERATEQIAIDLQTIRARIERGEENLARLWAKSNYAKEAAGSIDGDLVKRIKDALPPDSTLVEFFIIQDQIHVWLVNSSGLTHQMCGAVASARHTLQLLRFQLARFTLGREYLSGPEVSIQRAVKLHLRELYNVLIAPIRESLKTECLVFAPHGFLHHVPFSVLLDSSSRALLENFVVSLIPSGSVYVKCAERKPGRGVGSLILATPDASTPFVGIEARAVADLLPDSKLLLDGEATAAALIEEAGPMRYLHIAAHGLQRRDNALYSAIKLGDSELRLIDLDGLRLSADLVTLSGCSTGLSVVTGSDELLGLMRGVLTAGARALLATLWDVGDEATAAFMVSFYTNLFRDRDRSPARALRATIGEMIDNTSDMYSWAAFQIVGIG